MATLTKTELVTEIKNLLEMGYTRFPDDKAYQGEGKSIYEHFQAKLGEGVKFSKSELKSWFKMPELKGARTKGIARGGNAFNILMDEAPVQADGGDSPEPISQDEQVDSDEVVL